ncbi:hypothetical protein ACIREE_38200 [Streptomyces sp. NPDC102467]|uniref:hypothetical protein n=1 Tax=Streptomyces sp. NPDC102467 TaxID=3366179 RepID=UPI00382C357C
MSHASAAPVIIHSARVAEAAPPRPLFVIETLDHSAGSTALFTFCAQAPQAGSVQLTYTYASEATATDHSAQFTFCAQPVPTDAQFTFCAQPVPADAFGAGTAALVAVEGDAVGGAWI